MNRTDAPKKQPIAFGVNGPREDLPDTTPSGDNTASYNSGFPPITMTLKSAGGLPPKGQDMNQILYELSNLARWASSGALNSFDATFATSIGGYPSSSMVISDNEKIIYINTIDGNTSNPNSGGAGWKSLLDYLNMSSGAPAIGIPFFWPLSAMPNTVMTEWADMVFLKFNDATFSATTYPKLALVYPALKLPEMRGEFIRVWDDGRGVDSGRTLLSAQGDAIRNITGTLGDNHAGTNVGASGAFSWRTDGNRQNEATGTGTWTYGQLSLNASSQVPTASENRPRNISWNFIVRAK